MTYIRPIIHYIPSSISRVDSFNSIHVSRHLCTAASPKEGQNKESNLPIRRIQEEDDDYYDDYEGGGRKGGYKKYLSMALVGAIGSLVLYASYSIGMELFGRCAPSNLMNETFDLVRVNDEVMRMTGDPMRAYGMDTGRHTEGRRNFVASRKYKADDGSNRTRIRYTVSGPRGKAVIYAEVSDQMESHEFVYLIARDARSGRVFTVEDNRRRLAMDQEKKKEEGGDGANPLTSLLRSYTGGDGK
eukprot:CAMPEP_0185023616 /NCGR_PEP_ID=MMETSP1103-20130426/6267_1 /TAXON_ID=36769 /ORGANISM="Paraphysomonas bandaiensis, Strain Caron Lab Isolate" /LENGTH=243 /DNA_ID=CAMNT_0027556285 /DNA_START=100 /DNA_END=831 /DNA_ORIENTATION=-